MNMKTKMVAGAALVLALGVPMAAAAQDSNQYDGYCYAKETDAKRNGLIIGAIAGGVVGSQVSKNEKGLGTVIGAVAGGALGREIGKSSVKCLNGEYYSYQNGAYSPEPAPSGYVPVYYKSRPDSTVYQTVYYDPHGRDARNGYASNAYNGNGNGYSNGYNGGYASDSGYAPSNAVQGYRDERGTWHTGTPVYGWRDSGGRWHESPGNNSGYSNR